ncbi:alcohol dehydrogenase [Talaromyces proteolyticus]|uniref:Alcohol dehydrogenase n=1 Tax=Talaromyces proteolyticus TaxID=1131652 RepID=A0AAD4KNU5_9EURO|nr:alcohol dehydrogenase [Talaromyces proteolyticus]KAH8695619.1 alcohol dehydrogenase [Talaromyces proteolyticus]
MAIPDSYKAFRRAPGENAQIILPVVERIPLLRPTDVLIRVHAVSLNYRDVGMLRGNYPISVKDQGIPASDCAGEVVDLGSAVTQYIENPDPEGKVAQLGGNVDGVLCQYAVFDESAACITCAGTTAWNSLQMNESNDFERTALMLGTGGVSMFALVICLAAGIHPIITSSSEKKLQDIAALDPDGTIDSINYRDYPDWDEEVLRMTSGKGVDTVLETVGDTSFQKSVTAMTTRGTISWIGFLGGQQLNDLVEVLGRLFLKVGTLKAIQVGSKIDQQKLCQFLATRKVSLKSIIGKRFHFEESPEAFDYLCSGDCVGKVVISVSH